MATQIIYDVRINTGQGAQGLASLNETVQSLNSNLANLKQRQAEMNTQLSKMRRGTAEYDALFKEIKKVDSQIKKTTQEQVSAYKNLNNALNAPLKTMRDLEAAQEILNNELKGVEIGTQEYNDLAQQLRVVNTELKNQELAMEVLDNEQLGSSIKGLAGGLTDIAGGLALIGVQGESVEKIAQTFAQIEGLSKVIGGAFDVWNEGLKVIKAAQTAAAAASNTLTAATTAQGIATKGAAVQQGILNAVMNANPVFLLIAGITALVGAFVLFTGKSKEAEEAEKKRAEETKKAIAIQKAKKQADDEARQSIASESTAFVGLIYQLKETNKNSKERKDLIKQINSQYGTTLQNLSDETEFQNQLNRAVKEYIAFQTLKVRQERADKYTTDLINKQLDAQQKINKALKDVTKRYGYTKVAKDQYQSSFDGEIVYLAELRNRYQDLDQVLLENEKIIYQTEDALEGLGASQLQIKKQIDDITNSGKKYVEQAPKEVKATEEKAKAYKDTSEAVQKLIDAELRLQNINQQLAEYDFGKSIEQATDAQLESIKKSGQYTTESIDMILNAEKKRKDDIIKNEAEIAKSKTQNAIEIEAIDKEMQLKLKQNNDEYEQIKKDTYNTLETAQEDYAQMVSDSEKDITAKTEEELEKRKAANQAAMDSYRNTLADISSIITATFAQDFDAINESFAALNVTLFDENDGLFTKLKDGSLTATEAIGEGIMLVTEMLSQFSQQKLEEQLNASQMLYDEQSNQYAEQLANREITQKEYDAKVKILEQEKRERDRKADQDAFKRAKRLAIINATIQTAQAVLAAFSSGAAIPIAGIAAGPAFAAVAAALGVAQIGIIASQQYKAARGGIVPGTAAPDFDSVPALLAPGETVINSRSSAMYPELLSEINRAGGGVPLTPTSGKSQTGGMSNEQVTTYGSTQIVEAVVSEQSITATQTNVNRQKRRQRFFN